MKKDIKISTDHLFNKTVIYNKMDLKIERNLYTNLERKNKISCVVGSSGNISGSSNLSLELER